MLEVRKSSQAFGRGSMRFIRPGNRKVLAYVRELAGEDTILCVVNLARSAQPVELNLAEFKGLVPIEMLGRTAFPPVGELPYLLSLPSHAFYWFRLSREAEAPSWHEERLAREDAPVLVLIDGWDSFFPERTPIWRRRFAERLRGQLEESVLPRYIASQRWYAGKGTPIARTRLTDHGTQTAPDAQWMIAFFDVESRNETVRYFAPLALVLREGADSPTGRLPAAAVARVRQHARTGLLADAFADDRFCQMLVEEIGRGGERPLEHGRLRFTPTRAYSELRGNSTTELAVAAPLTAGSNTAVQLGERLFMKGYRRIQPGVNPELEVGRFLTEVAHFPHIVPLAGAVEYVATDETTTTLVLLQAYVRHQGDLWSYTANYLARFLEDHRSNEPPPADVHAGYITLARTLGTRTAELHKAFATPTSDPAFSAEPITEADLSGWRDYALREGAETLELLGHTKELPEARREQAAELLGHSVLFDERAHSAARGGLKIRHHGDYHMGQVLLQRNDFVIVDFEGEPARPLAERRKKTSPLRDVAGMLRSFAYARHAALKRCGVESSEDCKRLDPLLTDWEHQAHVAFLDAYEEGVRDSGLYPSFTEMQPLLALFETEKALYELRYELRNRPDWVDIPLSCLETIAASRRG
jgi:maltose alpha-D-glucosyltransferase/alpha-amylase